MFRFISAAQPFPTVFSREHDRVHARRARTCRVSFPPLGMHAVARRHRPQPDVEPARLQGALRDERVAADGRGRHPAPAHRRAHGPPARAKNRTSRIASNASCSRPATDRRGRSSMTLPPICARSRRRRTTSAWSSSGKPDAAARHRFGHNVCTWDCSAERSGFPATSWFTTTSSSKDASTDSSTVRACGRHRRDRAGERDGDRAGHHGVRPRDRPAGRDGGRRRPRQRGDCGGCGGAPDGVERSGAVRRPCRAAASRRRDERRPLSAEAGRRHCAGQRCSTICCRFALNTATHSATVAAASTPLVSTSRLDTRETSNSWRICASDN